MLLKELNQAQLLNLYKNNSGFAGKIDEMAYSSAMDAQAEESRLLGADVFEYHDHYASFYLTTPKVNGGAAPEKVAGALDADYLSPENAKLYAELMRLNAIMEDAEEWNEDREEYQKMCEICDRLADGVTEQLREFETVTEDSISAELDSIREGWSAASDWETDGETVTETIKKVYK